MSSSQIQSFEKLAQQISTLERPTIVAIDGRSASGKTTFAERLALFLNAPLVHTDDVAWHHSFFDWWPLIIQHILEPFEAGQPIDWTPEAWSARGRTGSILVPKSPVLLVEGVSATRRELTPWIDFPIWSETNLQVAEKRGLERDGPENSDFWFEWQNSERPFLEQDRPWERAQLIVDGAPTLEHDPETHFVRLKYPWTL